MPAACVQSSRHALPLACINPTAKCATFQQRAVVGGIGQCADPAIGANANLIVSGDNDLLILKQYHNIPILSPADALGLIEANK